MSDVLSPDLLGAVVTLVIFCGCLLVFFARLANRHAPEYWAGVAVSLMVVPLAYLLWVAIDVGRPVIYFIQLCVMMVFLLVEFVLDYVLKFEFRNVRWMVILYVTLFFAATGGMIGVASNAGRVWMYSAIVLFLAMGSVAFYQRAKTGK